MFTADAALISSPPDAGVGPKNIQNACPGGQYPNSPSSNTSLLFSSSSQLTGILKYISPPHRCAFARIGRAPYIALPVILSFNSASKLLLSTLITIPCPIFSLDNQFQSPSSLIVCSHTSITCSIFDILRGHCERSAAKSGNLLEMSLRAQRSNLVLNFVFWLFEFVSTTRCPP